MDIQRDSNGYFAKGRSANPGGRKRSLGLSPAVRASEGLKTWATLLAIRDGKIREQVMDQSTGETYDVVPSIKELRQVCQLILSYTWGRPSEMDQDGMLQRVKDMEERLIAYEQARLITSN